MRRLICIVTAAVMLVSACGKLPSKDNWKLPWKKERPRIAVVQWDKLVKEHPKYQDLQAKRDVINNSIKFRDKQLEVGQNQLQLLNQMRSMKNQGKQNYMQAEFAAKMAEQEAIENERLRKLEQAARLAASAQVAKDKATIDEAYRLPLLNLRMKLESVKMNEKARKDVLKELEEVLATRARDYDNASAKQEAAINEKMAPEMAAARSRMSEYAKELQGTLMAKGLSVQGSPQAQAKQQGPEELEKLIGSMDKQIQTKQEEYDKMVKSIDSDIESAIKKINLSKKFELIIRDPRANISATDITDEVSTEVQNIAN